MECNIKYNSFLIDGKLIEITGENVSIKIREATEAEIEDCVRNNQKNMFLKGFNSLEIKKDFELMDV